MTLPTWILMLGRQAKRKKKALLTGDVDTDIGIGYRSDAISAKHSAGMGAIPGIQCATKSNLMYR